MADEKKTRQRRKFITQPCRLPLENGDVAEVIIRFPESAARMVHWQITSESVLITVDESTLVKGEPRVQRATPSGPFVQPAAIPFHSSAMSLDDEIAGDPELQALKERGASIDEIEEVLAQRRLASAPLRMASSSRGQQIAKAASSLRRISVDVDGEHVEQELSVAGGVT